jgi:phage terminase large subunit
MQRFNKVYPDPENASLIEALKKRSVNVRTVNKGKGSIIAGINTVHELLKQNRIRIMAHCIKTIQAFEMYSYRQTKGDKTPDELPSHDFSDMLDALRYVVMTDAASTSTFGGPKIHYSSNKQYGRMNKIPAFN